MSTQEIISALEKTRGEAQFSLLQNEVIITREAYNQLIRVLANLHREEQGVTA